MNVLLLLPSVIGVLKKVHQQGQITNVINLQTFNKRGLYTDW